MGRAPNKMARYTRFAIAMLLFSSLFVCAVKAEEDQGGANDNLNDIGGGEEDMAKEAAEELERMDADKDGKVSLDEISTYFRKEFYSDEDMAESTEGKDGKPPTQEEIAELVKNDATEFLNELDKNKDGFLDLEELKEQYNTDGMDMEDDEASMGDEDEDDFGEDEDAPEIDEE